MSDLENLDQRAQRAAGDVRSRAAARPRPAFDADDARLLPAPARLEDRRPRRSLLAAAAVVLLVLAGGLAFVARHQAGDGDGPASPTTTTEPPRPFVATDWTLPKGMTFAGTVALVAAGGKREVSPLQIYGPSTDRPELGVGLLTDESNTYADTKKMDVGGRTVLTADNAGLGKRVVIVRRGKLAVFAMSPVLDRSTLADIAEGAEVDRAEAKVPGSVLPDGFRLLAEEPDPFGPMGMVSLRNGAAEGLVSVYARTATRSASGSAPGDIGFVTVASTAGGEPELNAVRLWSTEVSETTVRGKRALLTSAPIPAQPGDPGAVVRVVTWLERPGELLRVSGYGVSASELKAVADRVRPVGAKEWADLVERTKLGEFTDDRGADGGTPAVEVGKGRFPDGTAWRLTVRQQGVANDGTGAQAFETPELTVALVGSTDTSSGTSSASPEVDVAFRSTTTLHQQGRTFAAGMLGAVDAVELRRPDGSVIERAQIVDEGGFRGWVAELTEDPTVAVALGVDGRELDRVQLSNFDQNVNPPVSEGPTPGTVPSGNPQVSGSTAGSNPSTEPRWPGSAPPAVLPGN